MGKPFQVRKLHMTPTKIVALSLSKQTWKCKHPSATRNLWVTLKISPSFGENWKTEQWHRETVRCQTKPDLNRLLYSTLRTYAQMRTCTPRAVYGPYAEPTYFTWKIRRVVKGKDQKACLMGKIYRETCETELGKGGEEERYGCNVEPRIPDFASLVESHPFMFYSWHFGIIVFKKQASLTIKSEFDELIWAVNKKKVFVLFAHSDRLSSREGSGNWDAIMTHGVRN